MRRRRRPVPCAIGASQRTSRPRSAWPVATSLMRSSSAWRVGATAGTEPGHLGSTGRNGTGGSGGLAEPEGPEVAAQGDQVGHGGVVAGARGVEQQVAREVLGLDAELA